MKKADIIKLIKANLNWTDEIQSEWLNKLTNESLKKILSHSKTMKTPKDIEPCDTLSGMFLWGNTLEGWEYWNNVNAKIKQP
jgi:hypothetical protein